MTPTGSLSNLKVIDASRVLGGPYCGQILADHGADVIKLEPPAGDETRGWGPPFLDGAASYFQGLNRNKRGIAVDISQPAGRTLLLELLADADVFLENFKTGTLERSHSGGLWHHERERRTRRRCHARGSACGRHGHRPERGAGCVHGAERTRHQRARAVHRNNPVRLRRVPAAPAPAQLLPVGQGRRHHRQRASQHLPL